MKNKNRFVAVLTASLMCATSMSTMFVNADSAPIVTIGADLSAEQRQTVLNFFGVDVNSVQIIEINNQQERQYLEGKISDSIIGTKTLSCSYIMPTSSGGIIVKTANLTYVTEGMLANALLTCGITDCQVLATAPFKVSGTGALTGVMTAYEQSAEVTLDENKKQLATEELILTGEIVNEIVTDEPIVFETATDNLGNVLSPTDESGNEKSAYQQITEQQVLAIINDIKIEVINGNMSEDKVKEILDKHLEEYKLQLTEETYNRLVAYLVSLSNTDYQSAIKEKLTETSDRIKSGFDTSAIVQTVSSHVDFDASKGGITKLFTNLFTLFKYLFGGFKDSAEQFGDNFQQNAEQFGDKTISIFSSVNTSIFNYDKEDNTSNPEVDTTDTDNELGYSNVDSEE